MSQQTCRVATCDECGKETAAEKDLAGFNRYLNLDTHWLKSPQASENTLGISASWDFCSWGCLLKFAAEKQKVYEVA